jgi:hypothetical protein
MAVTKPWLLTVATAVLEDVQVAVEVMSLADRSLKFALAVSCCVAFTFRDAVGGVTAMEVIVVAGGGVVVPLLTPAHPAIKQSERKGATTANLARNDMSQTLDPKLLTRT